jgi:hypothetical protein
MTAHGSIQQTLGIEAQLAGSGKELQRSGNMDGGFPAI